MLTPDLNIPEYDAHLFVNRTEEINSIKAMLERLKQSGDEEIPAEQRVRFFQGSKGIGKTWLRCRIKDIIEENEINGEKIPVWCIDLKEMDALDDDPDIAVRLSLEMIAQQMGLALSTRGKTMRAARAEFLKQVYEHYEDKPFFLLVDHLFEQSWDLTGRVEEHILAPLVVLPRVHLILFGRGRIYPFKTPELHLAIPHMLLKFNSEDVDDHIRKLIKKQRDEGENLDPEMPKDTTVSAYTRGMPAGDYFVSKFGYIQAAQHYLDYVLDQLFEKLGVQDQETERKKWIRNLEAIAPLTVVKDSWASTMLNDYRSMLRQASCAEPTAEATAQNEYTSGYTDPTLEEARRIREALVETGLAEVCRFQVGYQLDEALQTGLLWRMRITPQSQEFLAKLRKKSFDRAQEEIEIDYSAAIREAEAAT